jgi:hypothetical protein
MTGVRQIDDAAKAIAVQVRGDIEAKAGGGAFAKFVPTAYATQVRVLCLCLLNTRSLDHYYF